MITERPAVTATTQSSALKNVRARFDGIGGAYNTGYTLSHRGQSSEFHSSGERERNTMKATPVTRTLTPRLPSLVIRTRPITNFEVTLSEHTEDHSFTEFPADGSTLERKTHHNNFKQKQQKHHRWCLSLHAHRQKKIGVSVLHLGHSLSQYVDLGLTPSAVLFGDNVN